MEPEKTERADTEMSVGHAADYRFDHVAQVVPDIAAAVAWYRELLPDARVLYQDDSWAFLEAGGAKLAFVIKDQHPSHLAWRVSGDELTRLAQRYGKEIKPHRDGTRSFYLEAPGGQAVEIIAYEKAAAGKSADEKRTLL